MLRVTEFVHETEYLRKLSSDALYLFDELNDAEIHHGEGTRRHPDMVRSNLASVLADLREAARDVHDAAEQAARG